MWHAPVVRPSCVVRRAAFAAGCTPTGFLSDTDPAQPGIDTDAASVDGLIVGHRLMASDEPELALRAYYRAAGELGLNADVLSALGSANLRARPHRTGRSAVCARPSTRRRTSSPPSTTSASS
jgi:hypothetical protein